MTLKAPFVYFGGKREVADVVWSRLGDTPNAVEPFAGSLAVLLGRPHWDVENGAFRGKPTRVETVNDIEGFLVNAWRAIQHAPAEVAAYCDHPVTELDLHSRHAWLVGYVPEPEFGVIPPYIADDPVLLEAFLAGWRASYRPNDPHGLRERLMSDPDYYDAKAAAWWIWGASIWIGSGWCSMRIDRRSGRTANGGVAHKRPSLERGGRGVEALARPFRQRPNLRPWQGVEELSRPNDHAGSPALYEVFAALSARLRHVRIVCGDWSRVCGPSPTYKIGLTGIFMDPPYSTESGRAPGLYAHDDLSVAHEVREWCLKEIEDGDERFAGPRYLHPKLRICLAGYADEHDEHMPDDWERVYWSANGGYSNQSGSDNRHKECLWFSPHCIRPAVVSQGVLL